MKFFLALCICVVALPFCPGVLSASVASSRRHESKQSSSWSVRHVFFWIKESGWSLLDSVSHWSPFRWIGRTMKDFSLNMAAKNLANLLSTPKPNGSEPSKVSSWNATTKQYLSNMKLMDVDDCLALLLCRVAGNATRYGAFGKQLTRFFHAYNFSGDNSSADWWFARAYQIGQKALPTKEKYDGCLVQYDRCKRNVIELVHIVGRRLAT